jgi:hypothetical protein
MSMVFGQVLKSYRAIVRPEAAPDRVLLDFVKEMSRKSQL